MDQSRLRRHIRRGIVIAALGLGVAGGAFVQAGTFAAAASPTANLHRLVTTTSSPTVSDPTLITTLDYNWF